MMQEFTGLKQSAVAWLGHQAGEGRADHTMRLVTAAVVLLFPAACLLVSRSDSFSLFLLLVIGLVTWGRARLHTGFTRRDWLYVGVFFLFFAAGLLAFELGHQTDYGFRLLGRYIRLLLVFPVLIAFKRYRPPAMLVWAGLGLGALVLGIDAIWERVDIEGFLQPDGDTNVAILFGDLATLTTFAFAAGYIYIDQRLPRLGPRLVLLCTFAGLLACVLSGARGAWMAIPVLLLLFLSCRHLLRPRTVLYGALAVFALFVALYFFPGARVQERVQNTLQQFHNYAYVQDSMLSHPAPACLDDERLLESLSTVSTRGSRGVLTKVQPAKPQWAPFLKEHGCPHAMVLHVFNSDHSPSWLYLPRAPWAGQSPAQARLMVSGDAMIRFGHGPKSYAKIRKSRYAETDMQTLPVLADHLLVMIPPRSTINLVPIEQYPGEYRYVMVQTSVGQRLQMWGVAWRLFKSAPLTGVGTAAYMEQAQQLVDQGQAPPITAIYDHPHNEILDALATRGLVGLVALLLLFGVPGWLFARDLDSADPARMGTALAGLMVVVGFFVFGLSETMLVHSITLGWYVIMTALFMVTADRTEERTV
jgi:hypothetical protein